MSTVNDTPNDVAPRHAIRSLPGWLDGRTIALATTVVTAALTLGTMMQTAHSRLSGDILQVRHDLGADIENVRDELRADIEELRDELRADIEKVRDELGADIARLDDRLRSVEIDTAAIRTAMVGFDARLGAVEEHAQHPIMSASPR